MVSVSNQTTTRTLVFRHHVELSPVYDQLSSSQTSLKCLLEKRALSPPQKDKGILPQSQAEALMSAGFFIWIPYFFSSTSNGDIDP